MSYLTIYLSNTIYNQLSQEFRNKFFKAGFSKSDLHNKYVSNVLNFLENRGETELKNELIEELSYLEGGENS